MAIKAFRPVLPALAMGLNPEASIRSQQQQRSANHQHAEVRRPKSWPRRRLVCSDANQLWQNTSVTSAMNHDGMVKATMASKKTTLRGQQYHGRGGGVTGSICGVE